MRGDGLGCGLCAYSYNRQKRPPILFTGHFLFVDKHTYILSLLFFLHFDPWTLYSLSQKSWQGFLREPTLIITPHVPVLRSVSFSLLSVQHFTVTYKCRFIFLVLSYLSLLVFCFLFSSDSFHLNWHWPVARDFLPPFFSSRIWDFFYSQRYSWEKTQNQLFSRQLLYSFS